MRLSFKFRFRIGILNQHWLVEQGRRPMTDWPAMVAPKWAIARNHAATAEEDATREAPVVPTGGQAGRWQAITDSTTIESSLVDLKEKGAAPQDRRFLYVDCIKRTTAALGVGVKTIEPDHHLLNHLVTSFVAYLGCCVGSGTGGGTGLLCANNKPSTPRYSPLGKPAHPTDRPTGTIKKLFFGGGSFFFPCALRLSSRSNRTSRATTKMSPYFVLFDATTILYFTTLSTMDYSV